MGPRRLALGVAAATSSAGLLILEVRLRDCGAGLADALAAAASATEAAVRAGPGRGPGRSRSRRAGLPGRGSRHVPAARTAWLVPAARRAEQEQAIRADQAETASVTVQLAHPEPDAPLDPAADLVGRAQDAVRPACGGRARRPAVIAWACLGIGRPPGPGWRPVFLRSMGRAGA